MEKDKRLGLRKQVLEKEFSRMNREQQKAVFHTEGPLLILAGAGSGKTTVLVNRIANMIRYGCAYESSEFEEDLTEEDIAALRLYLEKSVPIPEDVGRRLSVHPVQPWQILAITFTNKAAGELKERLAGMLGSYGEEIWAATFHSTCARILRREGERIGFGNHFTVYDTDDTRRLMRDCLKTLNIEERQLPCKAALAEISHAKDRMLSPEEYCSLAGGDFRLKQMGEAYKLYQRRLKEADAMDFDDLLCNTVRLFRECPDVLEKYQNRFRYILVDEYQDTNPVQYEMIRLLAQKRRNLCVVGDDDQSIYKFRGATIENIMSFEQNYPEAMVIRLEQNYRSTQHILDAANAVIAHNEERKGKTLWTHNPAGELIHVHTAYSEADEANYIANVVLEGVAKGRRYSDYAILYRMNSQSNTLEKIFVKSGIPYRIIGGFRFYERKEIRDMIAYLSVINNPYDEIRLRRIINQPKRSIGDKTVSQAVEISAALGEGLLDVIRRADEFEPLRRAAPKLQKFAHMIDGLMEASRRDDISLHELYQMILDQTGYIEAILAEKDDSESRVENINELASNLMRYEEENGEEASLSGFLEEVSLMTDIDNYDTASESVVMMTMHSAKGLEFPVVFLPGFEEGIFPGMQAIYEPKEVEEERRLAYVGITRAREALYILNADSRMLFGSTSRNKPSRFSREIPEDLIDRTRSRDWKKPDPGVKAPVSSYETRMKSTTAARSFNHLTPPPAVSKEEFHLGDAVSHKTFGNGTVVRATPMGNDVLLEISFEGVGTKKLMANFARLQRG
jgi:DNA helicase-2/ATP-dependent DNA helicase PcrA